jgi:3-hydroxybutyryl-CoA dehydratase
MIGKTLQVGQNVSIARTIAEKDIETFAELSLDRNRVHFDEDFASKTIFGKRIAHGMVGAALISGALTELMGNGNIWLSVSIKFEKAIYIGDELTCILTITDINRRGIASIDVEVTNATGEKIISGSVQSMRFLSISNK